VLSALVPFYAGPIASLTAHLSDPFGANWAMNIGKCVVPATSEVQGLTIPLTCLWPAGQH
jgi:light-harvesting complex I chlorophyll a/b binding protein 4